MKTWHKILLTVGFFISVIAATSLTQVLATQPLSSETLREQLGNFISFTKKTAMLITLYDQKKLQLHISPNNLLTLTNKSSVFIQMSKQKKFPQITNHQ